MTSLAAPVSPHRGPFARAGMAVVRLGLDRPATLVVWTIVIGTLLRIATAAIYGFGNGEGYYLATARHLALSYFDQPPLSLWVAHATMAITGSEEPLVLRLPFILMFAATTWLMFRLGALLFGEAAGAFAALLLNASPVFTGMAGVWMQPDGPLMLFLVATMLFVARIALAPQGARTLGLWLGAGVALGLAMLAKYHAALVIAGIVIFAITSPAHRRWFREPGPYFAVLVAAILFAPVVIWNAQNDWVSFGFQSGRLVESPGLHPEWLGRMILGQILYIGPWVFVPMVPVFVAAVRRGRGDPRGWLLCCSAFLPVVVFTAASLWAPLGWHFHWQAPGYLMLFPLVGAAAVGWAARREAPTGRWLLCSAVASALVLLVFTTQSAFGWLRALVPDGIAEEFAYVSDPTLEGLDWDELRAAVASDGLLGAPDTFAVAPMWHLAGKVDVQLGRDMPVVCLCQDPRNIAFGFDHRDFAGWSAVIVIPPGYVDDVMASYGPYFAAIEPLVPVEVRRGGVTEIVLGLYLASGYTGGYPLPLPP
ncbi:MAG: glycosyltransferase family 39 protein [Bauldia sp.]